LSQLGALVSKSRSMQDRLYEIIADYDLESDFLLDVGDDSVDDNCDDHIIVPFVPFVPSAH